MNDVSRTILRPSRVVAKLFSVMMGVILLAAACTETGAIPAAVVQQLDLENNSVADLTEPGAEQVPRLDLLRAANRARGLGTELRFVIAGVDDELVSASAVVARYGGTVLSYKANDSAFEVASKDIHSDQIDQAIVPAGQSSDIGSSANAFVDVLERDGLRSPGRDWWPVLAALMLAAALVFLPIQAFRFWKARKRAAKRRRDFEERKAILRDWAAQVAPEVEALEGSVALDGDAARTTLNEVREFADIIVAKVDDASSSGDLDAAEMRIGRTHIKLRDLRAGLAAR